MKPVRAWPAAVAFAALAACSIPPLKEYAYPAWGFAVSFRAAPKATATPASPDGPAAFETRDEAAGRTYVVDASASAKSDDETLSETPNALAAAADGQLANLTYVATGKVVGREALIEKNGAFAARIRVFARRGRLYELIATSPLGADDTFVTEFLDSFRLTGG